MAGATVALYLRIGCTQQVNFPTITAGKISLGSTSSVAGSTYIQYPSGQGDIIWQGAKFGFVAPGGSGAQVQRIVFQLNHRVGVAASFSSASAQVYAGASPIGSPFSLTVSASYVTDTFTLSSGYSASQLPNLAVRITYHAIAPSLVFVNQLSAQASYSFPNAITPFAITGITTFPAPLPHVTLPRWREIATGQQVFSLAPSFGQSPGAGSLLVGWVFSNSGSASFDTTCSDPSWTVATHAGGAFAWLSLWYKLSAKGGDSAPSFSTPASAPMSQLAEFSVGIGTQLDRTGVNTSGSSAITVSASNPDTKSGDLMIAIVTWGGSNHGPAVINYAGTDSASNPMMTWQSQNPLSSGIQFYAFGWGQTGQAFAPGNDSVTANLGIFAGAQAVLASFTVPGAAPFPQRQFNPTGIVNRAITTGIRIG